MAARQAAASLAARSIQLLGGRCAALTPAVGCMYSTQASAGTSTIGSSFRFFKSYKSPAGLPLWLRRGYAAGNLPEHTVMLMPALSPTMTQGNIAAWVKKEGEQVAPGDILAEVETDKSNIEWEAQEEGYLAKILAPSGSKDIEVGAPVAVLVEEKESIAAFKDFTVGDSAPAASSAPSTPEPASDPAPPPPPPSPSASTSSFPPHEVINMPSLSPTMSEGTIAAWLKQPGDRITAGDLLAEVETDKSTIGWEAQSEEGYLAKILVEQGTPGISVGTAVAVIVEDEASIAAFENFSASDIGSAPAAAAAEPAAPATPTSGPPPPTPAPAAAPEAPSTPPASSGRIDASPYAKKLAAEAGVDLASLQGSGPGGRIVAADVQAAPAGAPSTPPAADAAPAAAPAAPRVPGEGHVDIPHSQIKRVTAARLLESKQTVPHYYLTTDVQMDKLLQLRGELNEAFATTAPGTKVSVNDLIIKASALALKKVPGVNASWNDKYIRQYNYVDISVAVQTPIGLMVPIVKDADVKSVADISADVRRLAGRAKAGKLQPHEFNGGTFTISNLGMMGVTQFAAIINPPQSAILAVGATQKRLTLGGEVSVLTATLSCDHRVIDGAMGAEWLAAFRSHLENPLSLLI